MKINKAVLGTSHKSRVTGIESRVESSHLELATQVESNHLDWVIRVESSRVIYISESSHESLKIQLLEK